MTDRPPFLDSLHDELVSGRQQLMARRRRTMIGLGCIGLVATIAFGSWLATAGGSDADAETVDPAIERTSTTLASTTSTTAESDDDTVRHDDLGLSIRPPAEWSEVDAPPDFALFLAYRSDGVVGGSSPGAEILDELPAGGAYFEITENLSARQSPNPSAPGRPESFGDDWGSRFYGSSGLFRPDASLWLDSFWDGGRTFNVRVTAIEPYGDELAAVWLALDSLVIDPVDVAPAIAIDGRWHQPIESDADHVVASEDRFLLVGTTAGSLSVEIYDPTTGDLVEGAASSYEWRTGQSIVWTGIELVQLGGASNVAVENLAVAYNPTTDTWRSLPNPPARVNAGDAHIGGPAAFTGTEVLLLNDGLAFDVGTERWRELPPSPVISRFRESVVWTGTEAIIWGGCDDRVPQCDDFGIGRLADGAAYNPVTDTWRVLAPSPLAAGTFPVAVNVGAEVIYFAGDVDPADPGVLAARYNWQTDEWTPLNDPPIGPRRYAVGVWTGRQVLIWGGTSAVGEVLDGAAYMPLIDEWFVMPTPPPGSERDRHSGAWAANSFLIVGGFDTNGPIEFNP